MNENIENMLEELKEKFPKNVYQKLSLRIFDNNGKDYSVDDEFQEKLFNTIYISCGTNLVKIYKDKYNTFYIHTSVYIERKDLAIIGKALSIVAKRLSKIEFE
ncbi:hypothetical protein QYC35_05755 [Ligilactobacillus salivarius]|uniref:Uncharacterized protein n=1 Tax=Ligilactobacillus salivarius TaxID=1624 RepID=A0AAW7N6P6_9LACO|nr:hypothetical protein [Ligilactobacillus salivarius]MDN4833741.1 hypothetical protein [Ligilactobacillus salivarius]